MDADENVDLNIAFSCFPSVSLSGKRVTCNTCSNCSNGNCSPGSPCLEIKMTGKVNGSSNLPSGWSLQWSTTPGILCSMSGGTTLRPTLGINVCKVSGTGTQTIPVTLVLLPPNCPPVIRKINVTYQVC